MAAATGKIYPYEFSLALYGRIDNWVAAVSAQTLCVLRGERLRGFLQVLIRISAAVAVQPGPCIIELCCYECFDFAMKDRVMFYHRA